MSLQDLAVSVTGLNDTTHILSFDEETELARCLQEIESKVGHLISPEQGEETLRFKLYLCWLYKLNEDIEKLIGINIPNLLYLTEDGEPRSSSMIPAEILGEDIRLVDFFRPFVLEILMESLYFNAARDKDINDVGAIMFLKKCCTQLNSPEDTRNFIMEEHPVDLVKRADELFNNSDFSNGQILNTLFGHEIFTNTIITLKGVINILSNSGWAIEC